MPYNDRGVKASPSSQTAGRAELNLLANLLGRAVEETEGKSGDSSDTNRSKFTLNLNLTTQYLEKLALIKANVFLTVSRLMRRQPVRVCNNKWLI